ncbi:metal-dependent transcriptional regulator [Flavobacteriaceae bacterium D16]|nr:metal-dependent transcriptional regulator [Flavobacteriaceae bacterium D16]
MSHSEENYLKTVFHLGADGKQAVATNAIARSMKTKPSSVTDMMQRLGEKGLVNYRKYRGVSLTEAGKRAALSIIRKHRLWEVFLVEKLNFSWDEVHDVAEQLEHIKSEKLVDLLDQHLGFPQYDPHGDPIPGKDGNYPSREKQLLSQLPVNTKGICIGVKDSSASFLKYLDKNRISLGDKIHILEREDFDNSLLVTVADTEMRVSHQIAANLYLKIL